MRLVATTLNDSTRATPRVARRRSSPPASAAAHSGQQGRLLARRATLLVAITALTGCKGGGRQEHDPAPYEASAALELERAARDLDREVAERDAAGWPFGVPRSSEQPSRPVVRIGALRNDTPRHVDMTRLEELVMHELKQGGRVKVLAKGVLSTDGPFLELEGSIEETTEKDADGAVQTDTAIDLRIVDLARRGVVVRSRTTSRTTRE